MAGLAGTATVFEQTITLHSGEPVTFRADDLGTELMGDIEPEGLWLCLSDSDLAAIALVCRRILRWRRLGKAGTA